MSQRSLIDPSDPIIVEQVFDQPAARVWKAITDVNEMRCWFFNNIPDFKAEVGFYTEFNVSSGERDFMHQWKIVEVEPMKRIIYDWSYANHNGNGNVVFELFDEKDQLKLSVSSFGMDSFDANIPEFKRENCLGGWNYFIKQNLKEYLSSGA